MMSSTTTSKSPVRARASPAEPSCSTSTRKLSAASPRAMACARCSSSSTSRTLMAPACLASAVPSLNGQHEAHPGRLDERGTAAVRLHELAHDGQPEPGAALLPTAPDVEPD